MFKYRLIIGCTGFLLSVLYLLGVAGTQKVSEAVAAHGLQTYVIPWCVLDGGGGTEEATSVSYRLKDAIGQSVIGECEGTSYKASLGFWSFVQAEPGVGVESFTDLPHIYNLSQNYPNPMSYRTTVKYSLPKASWVRLKVYNIYGRLIKTLVNKLQKAGYYTVRWNGRDNAGKEVSNGIYLYRLEAGSYTATRKVVLVK